jgi:hypothetical protein
MSPQSVDARWVIVGKRPGDKADYRILGQNWSQDEGHGDLTQLILATVPGLPHLGVLPGAGSLPWVTFLPARGAASRPWLTITVVDPTSDRDAVGRRNLTIRHVAAPFAKIAAAGTGYRTLYAAIPPAAEFPGAADPGGTTSPLQLALAGADTAVSAALADPAVFDRAARLAATLLCEQVIITLTDEAPLSLAARLEVFDQVTALLPTGMRAGLTLASWHDGTRARALRLAFGPFAAHGEAEARLDDPPPPPAYGTGHTYWQALIRLHGEFGAAGLIEHLARHRQPLAPDNAGEAVQIVQSLAEPQLVVAAARSGRLVLEQVLNVRHHSADRLDRDSLDALELYLMARPDTDDEIQAGWGDRSAVLAARIILSEVLTGIAEGTIKNTRRFYVLAEKNGHKERFLAAIAERKALNGRIVPSSTAAWLIRGLITPERGKLPETRRAVLDQPPVARWLIRQSLLSGPDSQDWVHWLEWMDPADGTAPGWLASYHGLATRSDLPAAWADGIPAGTDPEDVALAARLAYRNGRSSQVTAQWWPVLLTLAQIPPDAAAMAAARADLADLADPADLAKSLSDEATELGSAVRLDTLRLYLELVPRYFPRTGAAVACRRYLDALWDLWSESPARDDVTVLAPRLLGTLLAAPGSGLALADPFAESAITLLLAVVHDDRIPLDRALADAIADTCTAVPWLLDEPRLTAEWWTRVERLCPGIRGPSARLRAAVREPAADPAEVALRWGRAAANGTGHEEIISTIGPWLTERTPTEISAMLKIVDSMLSLGPSGARRDYLLQTVGHLIGTALPPPLARSFADYELERTSGEHDFLRQLRRTVTRRRPR